MRLIKVVANALLVFGTIAPIFAQEVLIRGRVLDRNTHREISGVNIYVKGTEIGTSSDFSGKYSLKISQPTHEMIIVFQHIAYNAREIMIDEVKTMPNIYLQPRVIPMKELEVEAAGKRLGIEKDLPQMVSVITADDFEIRGFVDAADLLRSDHSIQVEEEFSGKKTVGIRAGNPDDVIVLYYGAKMNSTYNNVFDLSLINLEDVERIEIIKGSNTALYGSEAFSGIVNIVPKIRYNYNVKLQQRFGTYNSGNWGLHLYQRLHRLHGSYSVKQGGIKRRFLDGELLENNAFHHTANLLYDFSKEQGGDQNNALSGVFMRSIQDYRDHRDDETLSNFNQVVLLKYEGEIVGLQKLNLSVSKHWWDESQLLSSSVGTIERYFKDRSFHFDAENHLGFELVEFLFKYQFENAMLDFRDERTLLAEQSIGLESATLLRQKQGIVSIVKFHNPSGSDVIKVSDFDISLRHDKVVDTEQNPLLRNIAQDSLLSLFDKNRWDETTFKFSTHFSGGREDFMYDTYVNYGTNIKFPTLFQQISSPQAVWSSLTRPNLNPERNTGVEVGLELTAGTRNQEVIYGYQLSTSLFRNDFENKLRVSFPIGIPVAFYDNVVSATLSGFETRSKLFLFGKKVTLEFGLSVYSISEKAAFPFKSDRKITSTLMINHAGYSFQLYGFKEGKQVGWIRQQSGEFSEVILPENSNLDFHLSKTFEWHRLKLFANMSARNVLNRDIELQGFALRDRRFYLTIGVQY